MTKVKVLIVGDSNTYLNQGNTNYHVTTAENYEEAIEQLNNNLFDLVITDADVPGPKSCIDMLRRIKSSTKPDGFFPTVLVCHTQRACRADGKTWTIPRSLEASYKFAIYFEGTLGACICKQLAPQQKRA